MMMTVLVYLVVGLLCALGVHALVQDQPMEAVPVIALVGAAGAWVGNYWMGSLGVSLAGVAVFPALVCSVTLIAALYLVHGVAVANNWLD